MFFGHAGNYEKPGRTSNKVRSRKTLFPFAFVRSRNFGGLFRHISFARARCFGKVPAVSK
jgi:hypothetical protein